MYQKGFAKIILILMIVAVLGIIGYLVFTKQNSQQSSTYQSIELGLSFKYPSNFKVYQQDENNLRVESDYKNTERPQDSIGMNIIKINPQRETDDRINFRLQGKKIIREETRNGYRILQFESGFENGLEYYILSDKGTFYIGDSLEVIKSSITEQQYTDYRTKFDAVIDSIRVE